MDPGFPVFGTGHVQELFEILWVVAAVPQCTQGVPSPKGSQGAPRGRRGFKGSQGVPRGQAAGMAPVYSSGSTVADANDMCLVMNM